MNISGSEPTPEAALDPLEVLGLILRAEKQQPGVRFPPEAVECIRTKDQVDGWASILADAAADSESVEG